MRLAAQSPGSDIPLDGGLTFRRNLLLILNSSTPADRSDDKHRIRKHAILNVIREQGSLSRAEISKATGFNQRTTTMTVDELVEEGLLLESVSTESRRGRPPIPLSLNRRAAMVMGIDIGRERTVGRLMDLGGGLIRELELATPPINRPQRFAEWAAEVGRTTVQETVADFPPLCGIGVGIPNVLERGGRNRLFDKETTAKGIAEELQKDFDVEVLVDTDAQLMALGTLWFGAGRRFQNFAVIKLGVSLGVGIVLNKTLVRGAFGRDMEFGHMPMGEPDAPCYCGSTGCLDTVACGWGVERMARAAGIKVRGVSELAELARSGHKGALEVFDRFGEVVGRVVATILNLYSVEAVVLSGRLSRANDLYLEATRRSAKHHALPGAFKRAEIIPSEPNARLAVLGTAAIVYSHIFHSHHVAVEDLI